VCFRHVTGGHIFWQCCREKARTISCLSNEKQIGTAMMMYTQDYDETLPMLVSFGTRIPNPLDPTGPLRRPMWQSLIYPYNKSWNIYYGFLKKPGNKAEICVVMV
jgi:hypothetical protein